MKNESGEERQHVRIPKGFTRPEIEAEMQKAFDAVQGAGNPDTARAEFLDKAKNRLGRLFDGSDQSFALTYAKIEALLNANDRSFHLHVGASRTLSPAELIADVRRGMGELAGRLRNDPAFANVDTVVGTSWIIGANPKLAELMGFTVEDEPVSAEFAAAHFGGETRVVKRATILREALIAKYGKNVSP